MVRPAGGQIRIVTKGGTTDFHGSLYEYIRNSDLNANTWGRNLSTTTNFAAPFRYNNFGFAVGGPIWIPKVYDKLRNKLFFFVAEDWIRYRLVDTQTQAVPTALMRSGNFSELLSSNSSVNPGISRPSFTIRPLVRKSARLPAFHSRETLFPRTA